MASRQSSSHRCNRVGLALTLTLCVAPLVLGLPAFAQEQCEVTMDVDGNGDVDPLTDGILMLRYLFGFRGGILIANAVDTLGCSRCTVPLIETFLAENLFRFEVDDNGELDPLTDGILILRSLFDFTGAPLVSGAVDLDDCERCTPVAIEVYLDSLDGPIAEPLDVWEPTTVPFDTDCPNGCEEVEASDVLPHLDLEITYHYDELVDDPIAQWADCLGSMLECLEADGSVSDCAAAAECPSECKALYASRAPPGADEPTLLEVLNGVYVNCGAPCRPLEEVEP